MGKRLKVKLKSHENDCYVELYEEFETGTIYGRHTCCAKPDWYYVSDPYGYCELSHTVSDDIKFIICDENGEEALMDSNGNHNDNFERIYDIKIEAHDYLIDYLDERISKNFRNFLLEYLDDDVRERIIKDGNPFCIEDNFVTFWHREVDEIPKIIKSFKYAGRRLDLVEVRSKSTYSDAEWFDYYLCDREEKLIWFGFTPLTIKDREKEERYGAIS